MAEMSALQDRAHEPIACVTEMARGEIFLARGIHCCHNFFCPTSVSILWRVCLYIHMSYCIEIVYELPLLPYNTAREAFLQKPRTVQRLTGYLSLEHRPGCDWANTWHWTKRFSLLVKQEVAAAPIYFHIFFLVAFLEEAFIRNVIIILH